MPNKKERYRHIQITRTNGIVQYSIEGRISPKTERLLISLLQSWHVKLIRSVTRSSKDSVFEPSESEIEKEDSIEEKTIWELALTAGTKENKLFNEELNKRTKLFNEELNKRNLGLIP